MGTLPESLYDLTDLESLDINLNQFVSDISTNIGRLTNLNVLQIDSNRFTGSLPSQLSNLGSLSKS